MSVILKILVGISGSGKTTWAKNYISKNSNWCRVSRDDYRYMWKNVGWLDPKLESIITQQVENSIESLLRSGQSVIYDATNLNTERLTAFVNRFKFEADIEYQIFNVPLAVALSRNKNRDRSISDDIIRKQYDQYIKLLDSHNFVSSKKLTKSYTPPHIDPLKSNAFIFDIDGTLAHTSGRRSHYDLDLVIYDDVDINVATILTQLSQRFTILIVTGREETSRTETEEWLQLHQIQYESMFMRATGDHRKDSIVKQEIYEQYIKPFYNVIAVFDDRDQVVKMWRELGLSCMQVNYGNF